MHPSRYARPCECGDHGFASTTMWGTFFIDVSDIPLVSGRAWSAAVRHKQIYAKNSSNGDTTMHRLIAGDQFEAIDHINHDGLDNRRANLRGCTTQENLFNQASKSRIGFKGVYEANNGLFEFKIRAGNIKRRQGGFSCKKAAARAYDKAAIELHGEFARTNEMMGLLSGGAS